VDEWTVGFDQLRDHLAQVNLDEVATITGVPVERFTEAARVFASTPPAVLKDGNGLDQQADVAQTVRAVCIMSALTGSLNIEGAGQLMPALPFVDVQARGAITPDWEEKSVSTHPLYFRQGNSLHDEEMFSALDGGAPVRTLIVQGGALLSANSNYARTQSAMEKIGFIAVHDLYMTATAARADLVLPAASFLERDLLLYYRYRPSARENLVGLQQQVVPPVGKSKSDLDMLFELARRVGLDEAFPWVNVEDAFNWELEPLGIDIDYLRTHPAGYIRRYEPQELYRTHGHTGFSTPSGKVELYSSRFEEFGYDPIPKIALAPPSLQPSAKYPLLCGTGLKLGIHTHTQFRTLPWINEIEPDPFLEIHPQKAKSLGICDGCKVRVSSAWGEVMALARVSEAVEENVVMLSYGYGQPYVGKGWHSSNNYITPHVDPDPISGATSNRRVPVRVSRVEETLGDKTQDLMLLADWERCVGCYACEVACAQEHGEKMIRVNMLGPVNQRNGMDLLSVPLASDGCDLCQARLAQGEEPACVSACPTRALIVCPAAEAVRRLRAGKHQLCAVRTVAI
jgi:anaerobic selenocysteine-containing dehydrogenase